MEPKNHPNWTWTIIFQKTSINLASPADHPTSRCFRVFFHQKFRSKLPRFFCRHQCMWKGKPLDHCLRIVADASATKLAFRWNLADSKKKLICCLGCPLLTKWQRKVCRDPLLKMVGDYYRKRDSPIYRCLFQKWLRHVKNRLFLKHRTQVKIWRVTTKWSQRIWMNC